MRFRFPFLLIFLFFSTPSLGESWDDLEYWHRDGVYHKKGSDVPFTGEIESEGIYPGQGMEKGSMKNGYRVGPWVQYYDNGQLFWKGSYNENGVSVGLWVSYWENGQLRSKYSIDNGLFEGLYVEYWSNGQLRVKGEYRNDKKEGKWESYDPDGSVSKDSDSPTGTYKNGEKISD